MKKSYFFRYYIRSKHNKKIVWALKRRNLFAALQYGFKIPHQVVDGKRFHSIKVDFTKNAIAINGTRTANLVHIVILTAFCFSQEMISIFSVVCSVRAFSFWVRVVIFDCIAFSIVPQIHLHWHQNTISNGKWKQIHYILT